MMLESKGLMEVFHLCFSFPPKQPMVSLETKLSSISGKNDYNMEACWLNSGK